MEDATLRLVVFSFILSLLYPTFAYAFTSFTVGDFESFDISLDTNQLMNAGIILKDAQSHNVTFKDTYKEFTVDNTTIRVNWKQSVAPPDFFRHITQSYLGRVLNTWIAGFFHLIQPIVDNTVLFDTGMNNITVINNFDSQWNWTQYRLKEKSMIVFISTIPSDNNNITKAIMETGTVTVTVGSQLIETSDLNFRNFASWYVQVVTGEIDFGLPSVLLWVTRFFSFITLLSGFLLARELLPL
jgi:hypothetical protein